MKIVTWNCNGALRNKLAHADALEADVLVIQECEDPARSTEAYRQWAGNYLWVGDSKNKGIGVFPKNNHRVDALAWSGTYSISGLASAAPSHTWHSRDLKYFLPFSINEHLTALAVWTKGNDTQAFAYVGQLWKYLQIHRSELAKNNVIILGDLNSNAIWDKPDRWWSHSDVVRELTELKLHSIYHQQTGELQGSEQQPTFFLQRNTAKPYHIDYAFVASNLLPHCQFEIGTRQDWLGISDHLPLTLTIHGNASS
ncbi:endonuclease/exonuclease/phosphatase family protein [Pseudomonas sp.]|uniref:endonuclease/exonuclease/phosphatase family protein n=1 Tax=Pseudomonas sp. TaxID=306 RepID=UPI003BB6D684